MTMDFPIYTGETPDPDDNPWFSAAIVFAIAFVAIFCFIA